MFSSIFENKDFKKAITSLLNLKTSNDQTEIKEIENTFISNIKLYKGNNYIFLESLPKINNSSSLVS